MEATAIVSMVLAASSMGVAWLVWVTVGMFRHAQEIALIKQALDSLNEVKEFLKEIRDQLQTRRPGE